MNQNLRLNHQKSTLCWLFQIKVSQDSAFHDARSSQVYVSMVSTTLQIDQTELADQDSQEANFQQDNAQSHTAWIVLNHFREHQVNVMKWTDF